MKGQLEFENSISRKKFRSLSQFETTEKNVECNAPGAGMADHRDGHVSQLGLRAVHNVVLDRLAHCGVLVPPADLGWKFMSCSHVKRIVSTLLSWLLIGCLVLCSQLEASLKQILTTTHKFPSQDKLRVRHGHGAVLEGRVGEAEVGQGLPVTHRGRPEDFHRGERGVTVLAKKLLS